MMDQKIRYLYLVCISNKNTANLNDALYKFLHGVKSLCPCLIELHQILDKLNLILEIIFVSL